MKLSRYCACGATLTAHFSPHRTSAELEIALAAAWNETHNRPDCAPATPEQARAARRRGKVITWLEPGTEDIPEAVAERLRPFVGCRLPDPLNPNHFCALRIEHDDGPCYYVPAEQLPASADDEGEPAETTGTVMSGGISPTGPVTITIQPTPDPALLEAIREDIAAAQRRRPGYSHGAA